MKFPGNSGACCSFASLFSKNTFKIEINLLYSPSGEYEGFRVENSFILSGKKIVCEEIQESNGILNRVTAQSNESFNVLYTV